MIESCRKQGRALPWVACGALMVLLGLGAVGCEKHAPTVVG